MIFNDRKRPKFTFAIAVFYTPCFTFGMLIAETQFYCIKPAMSFEKRQWGDLNSFQLR